MLALFFLSAVKNLKNAAAQPAGPPAEQEALTSKQQSRQRGFKFQKEVSCNDTRRGENDFRSPFFPLESAAVPALLSVVVIYIPSKSFPSRTNRAKVLFLFFLKVSFYSISHQARDVFP